MGAAWAGPADPRVGVTLDPVPERVTLSRAAGAGGLPLQTYAAWRVTLTNGTTNTLNRVFFDGTLANVGSSEAVLFDGTVPSSAGCTGVGTSRLVCSLGSLAPGAQTSFFVVARSPRSGSRIDLNWRGGGDEGNGNGNGCCDVVGQAQTTLVDPSTDPSFQREAKSFVRPAGGLLFTGAEAISTSSDGWTTLVRVPPFTSLPQTTATVVETPQEQSCAPYALAGGCFVTDLTIPGTFDALEIQFRWDKAFFKLGQTKPENVKLYYEGSLGRIELQSCSVLPAIPGRPCLIEPPRRLGSQDTSIKELWGDLLFRVQAIDNGRYIN